MEDVERSMALLMAQMRAMRREMQEDLTEFRADLRELQGQVTLLVDRTARLDERVPQQPSTRRSAVMTGVASVLAAAAAITANLIGIGS